MFAFDEAHDKVYAMPTASTPARSTARSLTQSHMLFV